MKKYVFERDPKRFEATLDAYRERGYRVVRFMVRPRPDGTAFCYAKLKWTFLGALRYSLYSAA